jgi:ABC-type glycerol-3-phosphate transport system permease component
MVVLIWIQTGFAMVILSAALRGIPEETIEAAVIDGANPFDIFFKIKVPQIMGTIVVVWTTITLVVLKIFDIVFAMTNGQWETQVLANYMYDKLFRANDWGVGSASAIVIMLLVSPILIWNVYNARKEMREGGRNHVIDRRQQIQPHLGRPSLRRRAGLLWLFPTVGLFVSSFRTADQISSSGWWKSLFPQEQNLVLRTARRIRSARKAISYVIDGNIFADE